MTNLNLYRIFCEVAKCGNITKASDVLYISQPAVSSAIKELETELNGQLFVRQNKGVVLTSYGQDIFDKIYPSIENLKAIDHYFEDVKNMQTGILRIGTNTSNTNQIISQYLIKFASIYPSVRIQMIRDSQENLLNSLTNQKLDIIYIDSINSNDYEVIETYDVDYQLIGNIDFFNKYKSNPITKDNFPNEDIILPNQNNSSRQIIDNRLASLGIKTCPKYEVDNYKILYDMVKLGLGIAFVNVDYYKEKLNNEVYLINSQIKLNARKISAVTNKDNTNPTLIQFIDVIKD